MTTRTLASPNYPVVVEGCGPVPCPFMVVGEAPGREEIKEGLPFVGASGKLLRQTIEEFGGFDFPILNTYITNAFKGDVGAGNRNPTQEELDDHWPLLVDEINRVRPVGILAVGAISVGRFLPDRPRMGAANGGRVAVTVGDVDTQLYPCYHPAYILRNSKVNEEFRYAIGRWYLTTEVLSRYESD